MKLLRKLSSTSLDMGAARMRLSIYVIFLALILTFYLFCLLGKDFTLRDVDSPLEPRHLAFFSKGFQKGYDNGVTKAEKEIEADAMTIHTWGLFEAFERLDFKTGLPLEDYGDIVNDELDGSVRGHNDAILKHIAEFGLPSYSKRRWNHELFDLHAYFDSLSACNATRRLSIGGQEECSPDGKHCLRLFPRKDARYDRYEIWVHDKTTDEEQAVRLDSDSLSAGYIEYGWGPAGSDFAVFRYAHSFSESDRRWVWLTTAALDLRGQCSPFWHKLESRYCPSWLRKEYLSISRNGE